MMNVVNAIMEAPFECKFMQGRRASASQQVWSSVTPFHLDAQYFSNARYSLTLWMPFTRSVEDRSFDAVFSHAALEHVYDLPSVARERYRVTRPNGVNRHQIDLRDHLDFSKPLEFLLVDDDEFQRAFKDARWKQGNRFRLS